MKRYEPMLFSTQGVQERLSEEYPEAAVRQAIAGQAVYAELAPGREVAVIGRTAPMFHLETTISFELLEGRAAVIVCGAVRMLEYKGDRTCVEPGSVYNVVAFGKPARVRMTTNPPLREEDQYLGV